MVFFDITAILTSEKESREYEVQSVRKTKKPRFLDDREMELPFQEAPAEIDLGSLNEQFGFECGLDENISVCIYGGKKNKLNLFIGCRLEKVTLDDCKKVSYRYIERKYRVRFSETHYSK